MPKVIVSNKGITLDVEEKTTLLKALTNAGLFVESPCKGKGRCEKCKLWIQSVKDHEIGNEKEVLSCQYLVEKNIYVRLPERHTFSDQKSKLVASSGYLVDHHFLTIPFSIKRASLEENKADVERFYEALHKRPLMSVEQLNILATRLREGKNQGYALLENNRLLGLYDENRELLGLAIDLGTTTIAIQLVDLRKGEIMDAESIANPQGDISGADVLSRIDYQAASDDNRKELYHRVEKSIEDVVENLLCKNHLDKTSIVKTLLCGNTAMTHLFWGVEAISIARAPYTPVFYSKEPSLARYKGIAMNDSGLIHTLPNISGYVGADTVSMILATALDESQDNILAIDLGTNGEVVLTSQGKMYTCSAAAGPAFEAASIVYGMRADEGAIEAIDVDDGITLHTIGDKPAVGICGSGLIDMVYKLSRIGLIDESGRIIMDREHPLYEKYLGEHKGQKAIRLALKAEGAQRDIWLLQKDIRELQLAKGAVLAGSQILLERAGLQEDDLDMVYLAGTFGSYVSPEAALGISLLPNVSLDRIRAVGNAAGQGAVMALCSQKIRTKAVELFENIEYIELSTDRDFYASYIKAMGFA